MRAGYVRIGEPRAGVRADACFEEKQERQGREREIPAMRKVKIPEMRFGTAPVVTLRQFFVSEWKPYAEKVVLSDKRRAAKTLRKRWEGRA